MLLYHLVTVTDYLELIELISRYRITVFAVSERGRVPGRHQLVPVRLLGHGLPRRPLPDQRGRLRECSLRARLRVPGSG